MDEIIAESTLYGQMKLGYKNQFDLESESFKETLDILDDLINMIHLLKTAKELG